MSAHGSQPGSGTTLRRPGDEEAARDGDNGVEMKVLFVSSSSAFFINHHLRLAESCTGVAEVHVAVVLTDAAHQSVIEQKGMAVYPLDLSRSSRNPFRLLAEILALRKLFLSVAPDVIAPVTIKVLFVTALANLVGRRSRLLGIITGLGYLFTGDEGGRTLLRAAVTRALGFALRRMPHLVIFSNSGERDEFIAAGVTDAEHSRVVPVPGVDPVVFRPSPEPETGFRVVLPARMLWEKGVGEFVEAAWKLRAEIPAGEFLLAGDADIHNPASIDERLLREWSEKGDVKWLGRVEDMPSLLRSCHVVCLPSYREGFPMALSEAMACARPIVTTDVPGCRDAVGEYDSGIVVPCRNAEALAEAIAHFHRFPGERLEKGRNGRRYVEERLSGEKVAVAFGEALEHLML